MNLYRFLKLDETQQTEILWYNGVQIGRRKDEEHTILLYQVESFYVEVFYNRKEKIIKKYRCFEQVDQLAPYLEAIDISPVYRQIKKTPSRNTMAPYENLFRAINHPEQDGQPAIKKKSNSLWLVIMQLFHGKSVDRRD